MGAFRKCEDCPYYNYGRYDGDDPECSVYGYNTHEDKYGNEGCYKTDKTIERDIEKSIRELKEYIEKNGILSL